MSSTKATLSVGGGADSIAIINNRGETLAIFATCDETTRQLAHKFVRVANEAGELNDVLDQLVAFCTAERDVFVYSNTDGHGTIANESDRVHLAEIDTMLERTRSLRTRLALGE